MRVGVSTHANYRDIVYKGGLVVVGMYRHLATGVLREPLDLSFGILSANGADVQPECRSRMLKVSVISLHSSIPRSV